MCQGGPKRTQIQCQLTALWCGRFYQSINESSVSGTAQLPLKWELN